MAFELNKAYNFNTRAPAILGATFKNAVALSIMDYTTASNYISPETEHVNVLPYLPQGTPSDPKKYTYILFRSESGNKITLALPWIDETTIQLVTSQTAVVTILNTNNTEIQRLRDSMILLGIQNFNIVIT